MIDRSDSSGRTFIVVVTPNLGEFEFLRIEMLRGAVHGAAGGVSSASNVLSVGYDGTDPKLTLDVLKTVRACEPFDVRLEFSEEVKPLASTRKPLVRALLDEITVDNGRLNSVSVLDSGRVYTVRIDPDVYALKTGRVVTVTVPAELVAQDRVGNPNAGASVSVGPCTDEQHVRTRTQRIIANFMARRADQITASDPDLSERLSAACRAPVTKAMA